MALGSLLAAADDIAFSSNYAPLPDLPLSADRERLVVIVVDEIDAPAQIVDAGETLGLKVPAVAEADEAFPASVWRAATLPTALYSTTATAVSIRIYAWV